MTAYSRNGDEAAFEVLLGRYRNQVFGFLMRATQDRAAAEDLYQETFFKLIRHAPNYTPKSTFRTFLFTIARNTLNDHYRKQVRNPSRHAAGIQDENSGNEPAAATASNPDTLADRLRIRAVIDMALNRLPPPQKEMFLLREEAGLDFAEAARAARCSVNTAKSRMRYALLKLRELLREYGAVPEGSKTDEMS